MTPEEGKAKAEALGLQARVGWLVYPMGDNPGRHGLALERAEGGPRSYLTDEMLDDTPFAEAFIEMVASQPPTTEQEARS